MKRRKKRIRVIEEDKSSGIDYSQKFTNYYIQKFLEERIRAHILRGGKPWQ